MRNKKKRGLLLLLVVMIGIGLWSGITYVSAEGTITPMNEADRTQMQQHIAVEGELFLSSTLVNPGNTRLFMANIGMSTATMQATPAQNQSDCPTDIRVKFNNRYHCLYDDGETAGDFKAGDNIYSSYAPVQGPAGEQIIVGLYYGDEFLDSKMLEVRAAGDVELILLTDWKALYDEFLDTGMLDKKEDQGRCADGSHDFTDLVRRIEEYTTSYSGTIIDVRQNITEDRGYPLSKEATDSGCAGNYADNDYTKGLQQRHCKAMLIDELINVYAGDGMTRNIVILGNDEVIPFYRVKDPTDYYGEVAGNQIKSAERTYMLPEGGASQQNPVLVDMNEGYIMSDVPYSIRSIQNIMLNYNWLEDPNAQKKPKPDLGIGRIFDLRPCHLIQAVNNYDAALTLEQNKAEASIFVGTDMPVAGEADKPEKGGGTLNMPAIVEKSIAKPLARWFEGDMEMHDAHEKKWTAGIFRNAFSRQLITWVGHADHTSYRINHDTKLPGPDLQYINPQKPVMLVGLGCHMGLCLSDHTNDGESANPILAEPFEKSIVNPIVGYGHGVSYFSLTGYGYLYSKEIVDDPAFHERMTSLFVDYALDYTVPTMGELWKRVYHFYTASFPEATEDDTTDSTMASLAELTSPKDKKGEDLFHITAAYGMVFYGLPTQPLRSEYADMCPNNPFVIGEKQPDKPANALSSTQLQAHGQATTAAVSSTIDIHLQPTITYKSLMNGETLFGVDGGTYLAPPNKEILPLMIITHILTKGVERENVHIEMEVVDMEELVGPYTLPKAPVTVMSGGVITGEHELPAVYPGANYEDLYTYDVVPDVDSSHLTLSVTPLQYYKKDGRVVLFKELRFKITYFVDDANTATLAGDSVTSGDNADVMNFDPEQELLTIQLPDNAAGSAVLSFVVKDTSGSAVTSHRELVNLDNYTDVLSYTMDTTGWPPLEDIFLDVHLRTCATRTKGGDLTDLIPPGRTIQVEKGTLNGIQLKDEKPDQENTYLKFHSQASWEVGVYDKDGNKLTQDLAENFTLFVDGKEVAIESPQKNERGNYIVELPLKGVDYGLRVVRLEVSAQIQDEKIRTSNIVWQIRYWEKGVILEKIGDPITDTSKLKPTVTLTVTVKDGDGNMVPGLANPDSLDPTVGIKTNVDGKIPEGYTVEEVTKTKGVYKIEIPLMKDMGEEPWVYVEAKDKNGYTDRLPVHVKASIPVEDGITMEQVGYMDTSANPVTATVKVHDEYNSGVSGLGLAQAEGGTGFTVKVDGTTINGATITETPPGSGKYEVSIPNPNTVLPPYKPFHVVVEAQDNHGNEASLSLRSDKIVFLPKVNKP